jgi:hypothetical protein
VAASFPEVRGGECLGETLKRRRGSKMEDGGAAL